MSNPRASVYGYEVPIHRHFWLILVTLGSAGMACLASTSAARTEELATPSAGTRNQLSRLHDPVIVPGSVVLGLAAPETARLRLHRFEGGRAVAIPYQFDQRDKRGDIVVEAPGDIVLDANDELVFMARDSGDHATDEPCPARCEAALEIEISDPLTAERGWVYLAAYGDAAHAPPRSAAPPYVTIDSTGRVAQSDSYRVEYAPRRNYFTGLSVSAAAGGRDVNLLRRSQMRGSPTFSMLVTDVTLEFTEQNSIVEIDGVRAGPVRAVRRARLSVDLGSLFPELPSGIAYTYHYATSYLTPSRVSFPWIMVKALRDFRFESTLDFKADALPARYFDAGTPDGVRLTTEDGELRTTGDHEWWAHSGDSGTMLHAFVIPERWREWGIERGTIVRPAQALAGTDGSAEATQLAHAGRAAGYTLLHMTRLREAGTFDLMMASIVLPRPFRAGDERAPLAMLQVPLRTNVQRVR